MSASTSIPAMGRTLDLNTNMEEVERMDVGVPEPNPSETGLKEDLVADGKAPLEGTDEFLLNLLWPG